MRRIRWVVAAVALGAGLLAVPGALPEGSVLAAVPSAPAGRTADGPPGDDVRGQGGPAGEGGPVPVGTDAGGADAGGTDGEPVGGGPDPAGDGPADRAGDGPADPAGDGPAAPGVSGGPGDSTAGDGTAGDSTAGDSTAGGGTSGGGSSGGGAGAVPPADAAAGLLSLEVPPAGTGETVVVPGSAPAPGTGRVRTVRVEVEGGLPVDPAVVAGFVLDGLNDPRGWGHGGTMSFARTDGDAEIVVVLASPQTSARLCAPLDTGGTLSCRSGARAIITHHRWVLAHPDYGDDRTAYRRYVVNHEVGHVLGHGHVPCPGPGVPAPVMMQQTKGLLGCAPNPWPYP